MVFTEGWQQEVPRPRMMITARIADLPKGCVHPQSTVIKCDFCGHDCWCSPATKQMRKTVDKVQCSHCFLEYVKVHGQEEMEFQGMSPEQLKEVCEMMEEFNGREKP